MGSSSERARLSDAGADVVAGSLGSSESMARALMGEPAFIRRARQLERAIERLFASLRAECFARWEGILPIARRLEELVPSERIDGTWLTAIVDRLREHPRYEKIHPASGRRARRLHARLAAMVATWNERWAHFLENVPLHAIHAMQADYNAYYPIERELALRGARASDFEPVELLPRSALFLHVPPLPEPPSEG